jgi:hypothetical protein
MDIIAIVCLILTVVNLVGFYLAYLYGRDTKKFLFREYSAIIIWPILSVVVLAFIYGGKILELYFLSALAGFCSEYGFGLVYHKTLNRRLWNYTRFGIQGYTSLLSIPMWGVAGVVFYFIAKSIGL